VDYAIGLGRRAGARRVALTHHKPARTDEALERLAARVAAGPAGVNGRTADPQHGTGPLEVIVAAEGEVIEL
jgi:hypothetical protein